MIRRAVVSDLESLLSIERRCFSGDRLSPRALAYHLRSGRASVLVDEEGGEITGYALVFHHSRARFSRLYSIAVAAEHRGKRIGERLLRAAEQTGGKPGCRLEIREDNAPARSLYRRLGYQEGRRRPGFYEDGAAALEMVRTF